MTQKMWMIRAGRNTGLVQEFEKRSYEIVKGKRLKELKLSISDSDVPETDFGNIEKAPQLGVFVLAPRCFCSTCI